GELVTLYDQNGQALGSVRASGSGSWRLELTQEVQEGSNTVVAKTSARSSEGFTFTLQTAAFVPVTIDTWAVDNVNAG
ncbi:hypothetical protein, partial [Pantoea trifolii]|uniref:hypothetical protein n=1 Tax=Candidatus Pantoea symbiotica TaxID=1884370 RepID=UPI002413A307